MKGYAKVKRLLAPHFSQISLGKWGEVMIVREVINVNRYKTGTEFEDALLSILRSNDIKFRENSGVITNTNAGNIDNSTPFKSYHWEKMIIVID